MKFMLAIATEDRAPEDLILIGKDPNDANQDNAEDDTIEDVEIFFDTIDENALQRSDNMLAKVQIVGKIAEDNDFEFMRKLRKLSDWARDHSAETTYRNVCIGIKGSSNKFQMVYTMKKMFVVDYKENYGNGKKNVFTLNLTQRANNLNKIETGSDWPQEWDWVRQK